MFLITVKWIAPNQTEGYFSFKLAISSAWVLFFCKPFCKPFISQLNDLPYHLTLCMWVLFFYKYLMWELFNSGTTYLSIMIFLRILTKKFEEKIVALSFGLNVPKTNKPYVDDRHTRFEKKQNFFQFLKLRNNKDWSF